MNRIGIYDLWLDITEINLACGTIFSDIFLDILGIELKKEIALFLFINKSLYFIINFLDLSSPKIIPLGYL